MVLGLLLRNYHSLIQEGDGDREHSCLKFFLLFFHRVNSKNYKRLIMRILVDYQIDCPAFREYEARWGTTMSLSGGVGSRVSGDWVVEYFNSLLSEAAKASMSVENLIKQGGALSYTHAVNKTFIASAKGLDDKNQKIGHKTVAEHFKDLSEEMAPLDLYTCKGRQGYAGVPQIHSSLFFNSSDRVDIEDYVESYIDRVKRRIGMADTRASQAEGVTEDEDSEAEDDDDNLI